MGRNRFVEPTPKRIYLSDDDWIEVKELINNGDQKAIEAAGAGVPFIDKGSGRVITPVDWERHDIERALVLLLDWSFRDKDDKPKKISFDALKAVDPETFQEINDEIIKHLLLLASEKKARRDKLKEEKIPLTKSTEPPVDMTLSS